MDGTGMGRSEQLVALTFFAQPSRLKLLRCVVRDAAELVGLDEEATESVILAVNEACMNVIQHAYAMDPNGQIDLVVSLEKGLLVFRLRDYARTVDASKIFPRDLDTVRPGGLGVHFIRTLMDECRFLQPPDDGGNLFEMKKRIGR
jgi:anti-sigma regulatory factor (Ser/Thr protein kinase)